VIQYTYNANKLKYENLILLFAI